MGQGLTGSPEGLPEYKYIQALTTAQNVFSNGAVPGKFYGFLFENNDASNDVYIQIFDSAAGSVTLGTTPPIMSFRVPAGTSFGKDAEAFGLRYFSVGMSIAATTTRTGATPASTAPTVHIWSELK